MAKKRRDRLKELYEAGKAVDFILLYQNYLSFLIKVNKRKTGPTLEEKKILKLYASLTSHRKTIEDLSEEEKAMLEKSRKK